MAEVVLFHHLQGLTEGVRAFAGELRAGGHTVHTPDLFDGQRPQTRWPSPLTRSPRRSSCTSDPISTTSPANSWPTTSGTGTFACAQPSQS